MEEEYRVQRASLEKKQQEKVLIVLSLYIHKLLFIVIDRLLSNIFNLYIYIFIYFLNKFYKEC